MTKILYFPLNFHGFILKSFFTLFLDADATTLFAGVEIVIVASGTATKHKSVAFILLMVEPEARQSCSSSAFSLR